MILLHLLSSKWLNSSFTIHTRVQQKACQNTFAIQATLLKARMPRVHVHDGYTTAKLHGPGSKTYHGRTFHPVRQKHLQNKYLAQGRHTSTWRMDSDIHPHKGPKSFLKPMFSLPTKHGQIIQARLFNSMLAQCHVVRNTFPLQSLKPRRQANPWDLTSHGPLGWKMDGEARL